MYTSRIGSYTNWSECVIFVYIRVFFYYVSLTLVIENNLEFISDVPILEEFKTLISSFASEYTIFFKKYLLKIKFLIRYAIHEEYIYINRSKNIQFFYYFASLRLLVWSNFIN